MLVTASYAMRYLGVSKSTFYRLISEGKLTPVKYPYTQVELTKPFYSIKEARLILGVTGESIYTLEAQGVLHITRKEGGSKRWSQPYTSISREDILEAFNHIGAKGGAKCYKFELKDIKALYTERLKRKRERVLFKGLLENG